MQRASKTPIPSRELRIVDQIRTLDGFEYDLAFQERRLTVRMESTHPAGSWRAHARARDLTRNTEHVCSAEGPSRNAALHALIEAWRATPPAGEPIDVDWDAVEKLLGNVRAV